MPRPHLLSAAHTDPLTTTRTAQSSSSSSTDTSTTSSQCPPQASPTMSADSTSPPATPSSPAREHRGFFAALKAPMRVRSRSPNHIKDAKSPITPTQSSPTLSPPGTHSPTESPPPPPSPRPIPIPGPSRGFNEATKSTVASSTSPTSRSQSPPMGGESMKRAISAGSDGSFSGGASSSLKPNTSDRTEWERITCGRHSGDVSHHSLH
jgi:hypothetical protein